MDLIEARRVLTDRKLPGHPGRLELVLREWYQLVLKPGDIAFDGGANVGLHTYPMARAVAPTGGQVMAVEALPDCVAKVRRGAEERGLANIRVFQNALASRSGVKMQFHAFTDTGYSGLEKTPWSPNTASQTLEVESITIDDVVKDLPPVAFIKLDLEGGEFNAIKGAAGTMKADRPVIVAENGRRSAAKLYKYTMDEYFHLFQSFDYEVFSLLGAAEGPDEWDKPSDGVVPYSLFIPKGHRLLDGLEETSFMICAKHAAEAEAS